MLAIGTFGNKDEIKPNPDPQNTHGKEDDPASLSDEISDFTREEIGNLQRELNKLLRQKPNNEEKEIAELPLDRFLNCPSSLEVDRRISNALYSSDSDDKDILGKCKDICADNTKKAIGKSGFEDIQKIVGDAGGRSCSTTIPKTAPHEDEKLLMIAIDNDKGLSKSEGQRRCFSRDIIMLGALRGYIDPASDEFLVALSK